MFQCYCRDFRLHGPLAQSDFNITNDKDDSDVDGAGAPAHDRGGGQRQVRRGPTPNDGHFVQVLKSAELIGIYTIT